MSSSDGKFFSKMKNAFKSDKKDSSAPSSPTTPKKTSKTTDTPSKSHENVIDEAYDEGRKFFHLKHKSGAGAATADSKSKSATGATTGATSTGTTTGENHKDILKEAYDEGRKLFHFHQKHGKSASTPTQHHGEQFAAGAAGVGVGAGAGAAGVAAATAAGGRNAATSTSGHYGNDKEVLAESSVGRVVTSPPKRSREPIDPANPGDFANSKQPTDPSVVSSGKAESDVQPGIQDDGDQKYTEGAKTVEGEGKFFDPKDTQGGVLGATSGSALATHEYNEKTKAEYNDLSHLKTKPSAYQDNTRGTGPAVEDDFDFQAIKDEAYEEGNKKGRSEFQSSTLKDRIESGGAVGAGAGAGAGAAGAHSKVDPSKQKEIHEENKSAYNPDGVTGILEQNQHKAASTGANQTKSSTGGAVPSNQYQSKDSTRGSAPSNQYQSKDSTGVSSGGAAGDAAAATGAAGAKTTSAVGAGAVAGSSALAAGIVAAAGSGSDASSGATANQYDNRQADAADDERISDLDRQLKSTEDKIGNLKAQPSNASNYAVRDEPIQAPKLQDIGDEDEAVSSSGTSAGTGVGAGATGALGAAAAYLGLKKGSSATDNDAYATGEGNAAHDSAYSTGQRKAVQDSAYAAGQKKAAQDSAYQQGQVSGANAGGQDVGFVHGTVAGAGVAGQKKAAQDAAYTQGHATSANTAGQTKATQDASYSQGQASGITDEAYKAGYQQGKDIYQGIDKNSTQYRDALLKDDQTKTLDPNAGGSAAQTGGLFQSTKDAAVGATAAVTGALGLGAAAGASSFDDKNQGVAKDAYSTGKAQGQRDAKTTGGYASYEDDITKDAYQAGKDKALSEKNATTGAVGTTGSSNTSYLAAAGAAVGGAVGAVGAALTGKSDKEQDVEDSLIEDAEKVDPAIAKLPAHKTNEAQLHAERTLGPHATRTEKDVVYSNEDKEWERETDEYNKKHGFRNPKESLLQEAEDADPAIDKLPAHKTNKKALAQETTLGRNADPAEKDIVYSNEDREWERETDAYNKKHGFSNPKESLLQEAEDVDPAIAKLPGHKTNKAQLRAEKTLGPHATRTEKDVVYTNEDKEWERETDEYNKKHGFGNPKESLLQEAEEADPAIDKLPAHKTNKKELRKEETLGRNATALEENVVYSNEDKEWERETDAYNKQHGFSNPKESFLQEAEDADPAIAKLPGHKTNKKELEQEKTLSHDATLGEREVVETNELNEWEREAEDYNVKHGFVDPKESLLQEAEDSDPRISKLPAYGSSGKVPTTSKDVSGSTGASSHGANVGSTVAATDASHDATSSPSKGGYLAAAGAALGGAVGYAFGGNKDKEHDADADTAVKDTGNADANIASLPAHKVNEDELRRETTLGPGATFEEKELVNANNRKLWEKETDDYNKKHGFDAPKESLLQEAEDHDANIAKLPAHSTSGTFPASSKDASGSTRYQQQPHGSSVPSGAAGTASGVGKDAASSSPSKGGYLAAAGAAIGGAVGYAFGGNSKQHDDSLVENAEKSDSKIASLPAHKVDEKDLKRETTLGPNATFDEKETVNANNRKLWEQETDQYNKAHGFGAPKEGLLEEAEDHDARIAGLPAHKVNQQELKRETTLGRNPTFEEKETVNANDRKLWEKETEDYNKKHGFDRPTESLIKEAEDADPRIKGIPSYKTDKNELREETTLGADATVTEKEVVASNDRKLWEKETEEYNKRHGFTGQTESLIAVAEDADPSIAKLPSYKGDTKGAKMASITQQGSDVQKLPDNNRNARHPQLSKSLAGSSASGAAAGAAAATGATVEATKKGDSGLDSVGLNERELYEEGHKKGKLETDSTVYSEAQLPGHRRTVSGASYNATKPIGESELPEPDLDESYKGKGDSSSLPIGVAAAAVGAGAGVAAAESKGSSGSKGTSSTLDPQLKQQLHAAGHAQGKNHAYSGLQSKGAAGTSGFGSDLQQTSYDTGYAQGTKGAPVGSDLKQTSYDSGYAQGTKGAPAGSDLQQTSYDIGYSQGSKGVPAVGAAGGAAAGLDSKLKQDLYEHGYAKGSTEAKQSRDALRTGGAYSNPVGTNHREAAVIGSIGGLAAGAAGASAIGGNGSHNQSQPSQDAYGGTIGQTKDARNGDESLVVEVIGIEDRDEALRTAKKASKKLDDKGVDLTTGKLVINANTKEIYKDDNASAYHTPGSSELGPHSATTSSPPSVGHSRSLSNTSGDSNKLDAYQQTEAAKKRLAEAARKNVSSTQKHPQGSASGLTPVEVAALSAGGGGGAAAAGVAGGHHESRASQPTDISVSKEATGAGAAAVASPPQKHAYPDASDSAGQPPIKKQDTNDAPDAVEDDEIFVNVKGIKDNNLATKIARTAVARLQKTHAAVVANVKELQVDASSGIVRDEHGVEIAQYPDLAMDKINSKRVASHEAKSSAEGTRSPTQSTKSPSQSTKSPTQSSKSPSHAYHSHSNHYGQGSPTLREGKKDHIPPTGVSSGSALAGATSGGLAAAAAAAAIRKSNDSDRPNITTSTPPPPSADTTTSESLRGSNKSAVEPSAVSSAAHGSSYPSHSGAAPSSSRGVVDTTGATTSSSGKSTIPGFNFAGIPGFSGVPDDAYSSGQSKGSSASAGYSEPSTSGGVGASSNPTVSSSDYKTASTNGYDDLTKALKYPTKEPVSPSLHATQQQHVPGVSGSAGPSNADSGNYALDTSRTKDHIPSASAGAGLAAGAGAGAAGIAGTPRSGVKSGEVPKTSSPEASSVRQASSRVGGDTASGGNLNAQSTKLKATAQDEDPNSSFSFAETSTYSMPGTWSN
ncbi:hypothetical protein Cantr_05606 [Candida viswanathii]|uniref:Uncharacterized protein n=1 Tax=Candida viswanathii TaxID=5486 RepID=A0A367XSQ8_9ASCO|nr:hypothetical protein Cantr_05606 [Candida viswanathii]